MAQAHESKTSMYNIARPCLEKIGKIVYLENP